MSDVFNKQRLIAQVAHRMVASLPEYVEELAFADLSCTCIIRADSGAVTEETRFGIRQTRALKDFILYPQRTVAVSGLGSTDMLYGAWIATTIDW